jgi:integrase
MSKATQQRVPSFRHHKATNQGYVELNGRRLYLGRYDLPQTRESYDRLIAEWLTNGRQLPVAPDERTVVELCADYWTYCQDYYRGANGRTTSTVDCIRQALKPLRRSYGSVPAAQFGPLALRAVRQVWIDQGLARKTINSRTSEVKRLFKWGASHELIPGQTYRDLKAVEGLRAHRSGARETQPVRPVPLSSVEAIEPHVSRQVWALVQLQLLTGARGGELILMRAVDLDMGGTLWTYSPTIHKTSWQGHDRTIYIGRRAQEIIRPFLQDRPVSAYLFSPREAMEESYALRPTHRRPRQKPNPCKTERMLGDRYTPASYRRAITRACEKAGVPLWSPHQLRHAAATAIRREFGLDAAQAVLGHKCAKISEVYATLEAQRAAEVIAVVG